VPKFQLAGDNAVAWPTAKAPGNVTPPPGASGVATRTFLAPSAAVPEIVHEALTVVPVGVPLSVQLIPPPPMVTPVASCKPSPLIVTATVVPLFPLVGLIDVSDGPNTVNAPPSVAAPPDVVTVTL
jgi:hypothetical protein